MKSYTDIEQSKKLAEILSIESADMWYHGFFTPRRMCKIEYNPPATYHSVTPQWDCPCWSLAALVGVLPLVNFTIPQLIGTPKTLYRCIYNDDLKSHAYDNPIDAVYELVLKLNELNLL